MADKDTYVQQIKQLQRSDPTAKLQWGEYVDTYLGGKRDPNAHDAAVLEGFLTSYNAGALPTPDPTGANAAAGGSLADQVKNLQRNDATAKLQWGEYCDTYLGGKRDPNAHDQTVLENFIQSYNTGALPKPAGGGAAAWGGKGGAGAMGKGMQGPGMWGAGAPAMSPAGGMGASANPLAEFIKVGQRQSQSWKAAWQTYCTNYGGGKFDPNAQDPTFIQNFVEYAGGLALADMGGAAGPAAMGMGMKRPADSVNVFGPPAKKPMMGMGGDPEKMGLVEKVKSFQKASPEGKEAWGNYCDNWLSGVRDPNRHDADTLRNFIELNCP